MTASVSVLVTVFNREKYLRECINSILASTWRDFELLIVDDASTDGSWAIACEFAAADSRIRAHRNESNLGDYPNRNRAASLAQHEYLKFVDADDLIYPHTLEMMVTAMSRHPEAALGLSWNVIDPPKPFPFVSSPRDVYFAYYLGTSLLGVGPTASIIKASAFSDTGGFPQVQFVGDMHLWLKLTGRWPLASLPPALVWWRRHEGQQVSLEQARPEVLNARFDIEREFLLSSTNLTQKEKEAGLEKLKSRHARRLMSIAVKDGRIRDATALWKGSSLNVSDAIGAVLKSNR